MLSVWFTVAFTVERFIAIQYPLQRPRMCTVHRAKTAVASLTTLAIIGNSWILIAAGTVYHYEVRMVKAKLIVSYILISADKLF